MITAMIILASLIGILLLVSGLHECASFWLDHKLNTKPHVEVKDNGVVFLNRWIIIESKWLRFYVHEQIGDDVAREFHDHPWWNLSIILRGAYLEHFPCEYDELPMRLHYRLWPNNVVLRSRGSFVLRRPEIAHRITLPASVERSVSLFFTGPKVREWGFWCKNGWRHWQLYCTESYNGQPVYGKRCGD